MIQPNLINEHGGPNNYKKVCDVSNIPPVQFTSINEQQFNTRKYKNKPDELLAQLLRIGAAH